MKSARLEAYFGVHHGQESWQFDMEPATWYMLENLPTEKQFVLPGITEREDGDALVRMPEKVTERKAWEERRIEELREKLRNIVRLPNYTEQGKI